MRRLLLVACLATVVSCGENASPPTAPTPPVPPPPPVTMPDPTPPPAPVEPAAMESLTLTPSSILSQSTSEGRVTLTREAPSGGALVTLASSVVDAARTPANVTVPAGSTSATFLASSPTVGKATTTMISATYLGVTRSATLTVGPPSLEAIFRVNSLMGPRHCHFTGAALDCQLDARESRGFPAEYVWTFIRDNQTVTFTARTPVFTPPIDCNFLADGRLVRDSGLPHYLVVTVVLQVVDSQGNSSANAYAIIHVAPFSRQSGAGYCGY